MWIVGNDMVVSLKGKSGGFLASRCSVDESRVEGSCDVICPFCDEGDFDLAGLKLHLDVHGCDAYQTTELV